MLLTWSLEKIVDLWLTSLKPKLPTQLFLWFLKVFYGSFSGFFFLLISQGWFTTKQSAMLTMDCVPESQNPFRQESTLDYCSGIPHPTRELETARAELT